MKYQNSPIKEERAEIFRLFLNNQKLRFSEIEKKIEARSNVIAYHLEKMQKENIIQKRKDHYYYLTKEAEKYIPIFSDIKEEELSPLPVILVALINKKEILLIKRNKRPYKGYWSLIGGKMHLKESFKEASLRQIKEKTSLKSKYQSINSIMHERVKGGGIIKHSFILFFTKVASNENNFVESKHGQLKWFNIKKLKSKDKIIPSDLWLIKNKLNNKENIKSVRMSEKEGKLSNFKILED